MRLGSASQTISINTNNYTADQGVTPSNAVCKYNGGTEHACTTANFTGVAAPDTGKTLLLGVEINSNGTQTDNMTVAPTFDVVVIYN